MVPGEIGQSCARRMPHYFLFFLEKLRDVFNWYIRLSCMEYEMMTLLFSDLKVIKPHYMRKKKNISVKKKLQKLHLYLLRFCPYNRAEVKIASKKKLLFQLT